MKPYVSFGAGLLAVTLLAAQAHAQNQPQHKPGDLPGPIDSLSDLQDTGRMIFKLADANNDGQISQKEATDAGNLVAGGFFFRADQNGDGILSQDESRQARDAFLNTKPWLRYVIETVRTSPNASTPAAGGANAGAGANARNPQAALNNLAGVFDTNNDKQLQASELRQAVQTTIQGLFASVDTNRDNELSTTEVNAGLAGIARQAGQAVFQQADTDNNGQISQAEFERAVVEPSRLAFRVMDLNHDGQISQQEADTARQVIMSKMRSMNMQEAPNSPRNAISSAIGSQTQPAPGTSPTVAPAPATGTTPAPATTTPPPSTPR